MATPLNNVTKKVFLGGKHQMTLDYGYTYSDGSFHKGIDLIAGFEDNVVAIADGKVINSCNTISGTNKSTGTAGMGNYVILEHANGYRTRYQHMKKGSIKVKAGDKVKAGQVIGTIGNTGYSTGRHLHFDISAPQKVSGSYFSGNRYYVDPKPYLKGAKTFGGAVVPNTIPDKKETKYRVTASRLNVRRGPGTENMVVKVIDRDDIVVALDIKNDWVKIADNQWVSIKYLTKI